MYEECGPWTSVRYILSSTGVCIMVTSSASGSVVYGESNVSCLILKIKWMFIIGEFSRWIKLPVPICSASFFNNCLEHLVKTVIDHCQPVRLIRTIKRDKNIIVSYKWNTLQTKLIIKVNTKKTHHHQQQNIKQQQQKQHPHQNH